MTKEKHRDINSNDLMEQLQNNAALLRTILIYLEDSSSNPEQARLNNDKVFDDNLSGIKSDGNKKTIF